jgi:hypothetical protein
MHFAHQNVALLDDLLHSLLLGRVRSVTSSAMPNTRIAPSSMRTGKAAR